jgi:lipopolysaccharide transport system ATP-binding protein
MSSIIQIENLGKRYLIGHQSSQSERYVALRDVLARGVKDVMRKTREALRGRQILQGDEVEEFWALRNVSFEVGRGEVVGIIGRNGAGKSTLLKILSRITEPSEGRVTIRGRVASLLEVGTGFHPELTGRENIFLNGAILGMTKQEIRNKFDEIVAFAEIEKFIDTPVKRYSSGMYVRLAFAVAAHLEPEILIVDEVLAVGDAEFQKKCLGKMKDVAKGGRTVLFVSHNMGAVRSLCSRGVFLVGGKTQLTDTVANCVAAYLDVHKGSHSFSRPRLGGESVKIVSGHVEAMADKSEGELRLRLEIWSDSARRIAIDVRVCELSGAAVAFGSSGTLAEDQMVSLTKGITPVQVSFPLARFANGSFTLSVDAAIPFREYLDRAEACLSFDLQRAVAPGRSHLLSQSWGYGSVEIPVTSCVLH